MQDNNSKAAIKTTRTSRDLVLLVAATIIILILSYYFDVFAFLVRYFRRHPNSVVYIDEIITALLTLSIGLAIFAWRRLSELKKETSERIRLQEELLKLADTRAEAERIISKQLRSEIELRKQ